MSETLGSYTLPNPTESSQERIWIGEAWTNAAGNELVNSIAVRRSFSRTWTAKGTDLSNIRSALSAAIATPASFTPWDGGTYTVRVDAGSVTEKPAGMTSSGYYHVSAILRQTQ
jgi:hypothetical protein